MEADTNQGKHDMDISRRKFIRTASGTLTIGAAAGSSALPLTLYFGAWVRRGEWVSLVGLGGNHIGKQADENDSIHLVRSKQKETDPE
jgi:hypothetical protein